MKKIISKLDIFGMSTSMLCAIHCVIMPIISSAALLPGMADEHDHNHTFDVVLIVIGLGIAIFTLFKDITIHKSLIPMVLGISGFIFLFVGIYTHTHGIPILNIVGGLLVFSAHIVNYRLNRAARC